MYTRTQSHSANMGDKPGTEEEVATLLGNSTSQHAPHFLALLKSGHVSIYSSQTSSKPQPGDSAQVELKFGKDEWLFQGTTPHLTKEMCSRDLADARDYWANRFPYFIRSEEEKDEAGNGERIEEEDEIRKLISSAFVDSAEPGRGIVTFPSWILQEMSNATTTKPENVLRTTMTTCNIFSANTYIPLGHNSEGSRSVSVLSGILLWVVWPPTKHNLSILQRFYNSTVDPQPDLEITRQLEDGFLLAQNIGDGLVIPPLCPIMTLTIETTVFAERIEITYNNFLNTLQHLPFYASYYRNNEVRQPDQTEFINAIMRYIHLILNGYKSEGDEYAELRAVKDIAQRNGSQKKLFEIWDSVKQNLADMVKAKECKVLELTWMEFLMTSKGRECQLCGKRIFNKRKDMRNHFVGTHWVVKKEKKLEGDRVHASSGSREDSMYVEN